METVTIYKNFYQDLLDKEFELMTELAQLKGTISALAGMDNMPEYVMKELKKLAES